MRVGLLIGVFNNSYSLSVVRWISQEVQNRHANLIVLEGLSLENNSSKDYAGNTLFRLITKERLDGLIILSSSISTHTSKELVDDLAHRVPVPVVVVGLEVDGITSIVLDNTAGFEKVINHLVSHAYKHLALISGPISNPESLARRDAFLKTVYKNGLEVPGEYILEGNFGYFSGYNHAKRLVQAVKKKAIDAIACANDEMAFAVIRCFSESGIRVPDDVAVTGFDDTGLSVFFSPPVTTVSQHFDLMAKKAVTALFELMLGRKNVQVHTFEPELVVRKSCGCCQIEESGKESMFPFVSSYRLNGRLQLLSLDELYPFLNNYLTTNNILQCYIVTYPEPLAFDEVTGIRNAPKGQIFYGFSQGKQVFYPKSFLFTDILPSQLLEPIKESMLIKPLFFGKSQYGFLFVSAVEAMAHFIEDLSMELCHYLESINMANEKRNIEKRLSEARESLMISNRKLNELTVKENLDKLSSIRYLAANMLQRRKGSSGDYSLILVEIDNFNEICALFGFGEGEYVIYNVSNILANSIREDDFLSHQSCERYVILVKNIQEDPIKAFEQRFTHKLADLNSKHQKPYSISFTWGSAYANIEQDFETRLPAGRAKP
ncbi:MAG: substrate-binding domain-containing protein [Clostridia bacterium]|nr:substrate-binding domain-containing protein [Clostridia bacterium]